MNLIKKVWYSVRNRAGEKAHTQRHHGKSVVRRVKTLESCADCSELFIGENLLVQQEKGELEIPKRVCKFTVVMGCSKLRDLNLKQCF